MNPISRVVNSDCMEGMRLFPDKYFELAIVDPPYGIGAANMNLGLGTGKRCSEAKNRKWDAKGWDSGTPSPEYFEELFRVSKRQIIWGGNYFTLPSSQYFAVWDKGEGMYGRDFAECEQAWVSSGGTRIYKSSPVQADRIHPTQKPVALYKWLLTYYGKPGDKILDTHLGSGSSRIAAYQMGFDFWGFELDPDYFAAAEKRFKEQTSQTDLFRQTA